MTRTIDLFAAHEIVSRVSADDLSLARAAAVAGVLNDNDDREYRDALGFSRPLNSAAMGFIAHRAAMQHEIQRLESQMEPMPTSSGPFDFLAPGTKNAELTTEINKIKRQLDDELAKLRRRFAALAAKIEVEIGPDRLARHENERSML